MTARKLSTAATLNRDCQCAATDVAQLQERIDRITGTAQSIEHTHPNLFSNIPVFLEPHHFSQMQASIRAIETVTKFESYRRKTLEHAPAIANAKAPHPGVFFGYDFHIGELGPKLIEINTNAGGAFLNIAVRDHQIACCDAANEHLARLPTREQLEGVVVAMFLREWQIARGDAPLRCIVIVDDEPATQFLYPEFRLAKQLFEARGIRTHIADLADLKLEGDQVTVNGEAVDLIYNRSTDFYLRSPSAQVLRDVFERDLAVVTPHPRAHALYANKLNLTLLSNPASLADLGVERALIETLERTIPATHKVKEGDEGWWSDRKGWFFKPESGYGSRGAYRGDKMTRRVFTEVLRGDYIAQALALPGERIRVTDGKPDSLKVDIRCYAYEGEIQLMAARLYQGQTTNFRTAGGGFAPVYLVRAAPN